jgi:hypothetical protein
MSEQVFVTIRRSSGMTEAQRQALAKRLGSPVIFVDDHDDVRTHPHDEPALSNLERMLYNDALRTIDEYNLNSVREQFAARIEKRFRKLVGAEAGKARP